MGLDSSRLAEVVREAALTQWVYVIKAPSLLRGLYKLQSIPISVQSQGPATAPALEAFLAAVLIEESGLLRLSFRKRVNVFKI